MVTTKGEHWMKNKIWNETRFRDWLTRVDSARLLSRIAGFENAFITSDNVAQARVNLSGTMPGRGNSYGKMWARVVRKVDRVRQKGLRNNGVIGPHAWTLSVCGWPVAPAKSVHRYLCGRESMPTIYTHIYIEPQTTWLHRKSSADKQ